MALGILLVGMRLAPQMTICVWLSALIYRLLVSWKPVGIPPMILVGKVAVRFLLLTIRRVFVLRVKKTLVGEPLFLLSNRVVSLVALLQCILVRMLSVVLNRLTSGLISLLS